MVAFRCRNPKEILKPIFIHVVGVGLLIVLALVFFVGFVCLVLSP